VLARRRDITSLLADVTGIDPVRKRVTTTEGFVPYDYLVLAAGGRTSYFGNDHWEKHAPGLKTLDDALRIRRNVLTAFERAETTLDTDEQERLMTIVVVGGGPTGVELAGSMAELIHRVFKRDFRRIDIATARVILIESNPRLLKVYPESLSQSALKQLQSLGVEVRATCSGAPAWRPARSPKPFQMRHATAAGASKYCRTSACRATPRCLPWAT